MPSKHAVYRSPLPRGATASSFQATRGLLTRTVWLLVIALFFPILSHAQFNASIQGRVSDPTGALVPGATVTLTDNATNHQQTTVTSSAGIYTFNSLPPDQFTLTVSAPGFQKKTMTNIQILPEQANAFNVQLALGTASQAVTVNASHAGRLDTETATLSTTINSNEIQHMPSFNRDVFQLLQLTPGTFGDGSQASGGGTNNLPGTMGPGGSSNSAAGIFQTENGPQINTVGGQYETNGISIDGISTVSAVWGGTSVITPSEDSVQDVTVVANSYDAENGRFSGAQVEVTTKAGTNQVHGSAFFKASRPGLNAYQRWNGYVPGVTSTSTAAFKGVNRDDERTNNFGGSIGGPFWKNRVFAFFNVEASPESALTTSQGWYDTSQFDALTLPSGDIATTYLTYPGAAVSTNGLIPETCEDIGLVQGVNCQQEAGGLDVGSPLKTGLGTQDLTYGGSSSQPGVGNGLDGIPDIGYYNAIDPSTTSQAQYNGRLDVYATQKDHAFFTIYWVPVSSTFYNGPVRAMNLWHHAQVNDAFSGIWNHLFSSTLVNQARANAGGWRWNEVSTNPQEPFGLPQDNIAAVGTASVNFFGAPGPSDFDQWTYDYNDVLTKTLSKQNIKMGGELTRLYYLNNPTYAARPSFTFENIWDFANDAPYFESGQFNSTTGVPFANRQDDRIDMYALFIQDDYKILPNLTVNLGLRWSDFGSMDSKENNLDVVDFGTGANTLTDLKVRVGGRLYNPQKSNFGPQIGFAWQPKSSSNSMVVRGGFGINYNQNEIAILANGSGNPPNAFQASFTCPYPFYTGNSKTSNPSCANTGILYETATNVKSLFGFAPNPATEGHFGSNNLPTNGSPVFLTAFQSNPKTIATYHYSLETEYKLPYNSVATIGYLGNQMRHLFIQSNFNVIAMGNGIPINPATNFVDFYGNNGLGNYNAMVVTLAHNFADNFSLQGQYTWAKSMDEGSGPYYEDPYPYDTKAAYGRSDYDVQNAFKAFGMWQPVFFHNNGLLKKILGEWSVSGIWNWHTGFPFTPIYNTTVAPYYQGAGYGQLRPAEYLGGAGTKTNNSVFEGENGAANPNYGGNATKYFLAPTYAAGPTFPATAPVPTPGIHRNSLTGPHYNDLDGSLVKQFGLPKNKILGSDAIFEFRADIYNVFNKINVNGSSIDTLVGAANPDGTVASYNPHFGVATGALGSRTIQLQARFSF